MFSSFLLKAIRRDHSFSSIYWLSWHKTYKTILANNVFQNYIFKNGFIILQLVSKSIFDNFYDFLFGHKRMSSWCWQKKKTKNYNISISSGISLIVKWLRIVCQCRGHAFNSCSRKTIHAKEQLNPHTTTN